MRDNEFTKILGWPGYRVYRHEIDEAARTLRVCVRRKRGNRKLICSGCGRKYSDAHDCRERDVRYLKRWSATRRKDPLAQMGVDEIYFGKQMRFITVVRNLDTSEPLRTQELSESSVIVSKSKGSRYWQK
jgi:hypothetical protein